MLVEGLHSDELPFPVRGLRPPRVTVVGCVPGRGAVHVLGDRAHLVLGEQTLHVEVPGLFEEMAQDVAIVVGTERAMQVERPTIPVAEGHRARRVDRPGVERGTKHEPPVQRVTEPARALVEPAARPHPHECLLVVYEVFELVASEIDSRHAVATPVTDIDAVLEGGQCPGITVDLDRQRTQVEARGAGRHLVATRVQRSGEVVLEELLRVECRARPVRAGAQVDRHA